jgi:hypothetical protein
MSERRLFSIVSLLWLLAAPPSGTRAEHAMPAPPDPPAAASSTTGETAPEIRVLIDSAKRWLLATADGRTLMVKAPTRFGVIEWTLNGRSSSRVAPFATATYEPLFSTNAMVFRGQDSARDAPGPLYEPRFCI